jgi:hypothetical protein
MEIDTIRSEAEQFYQLVTQGIEAWMKAGQIVARQLDRDPKWAEKVCQLIPGMTEETIYRFDAIGRNQLAPKLMLANCPGYRALAQLPVELQHRHLEQPVKLLVFRDGRPDTLLVDVQNLTKQQCRQVFSNKGIRSEAQQQAWIESQQTKVALQIPAKLGEPYYIRGQTVHIQKPMILTQADVMRMLSKMIGA